MSREIEEKNREKEGERETKREEEREGRGGAGAGGGGGEEEGEGEEKERVKERAIKHVNCQKYASGLELEGYRSCHWEARWDDESELGSESETSSGRCVHVHRLDESHLLRQDCQDERDERGHLEAQMVPLMADNEVASKEDDPRNQPVG